MRYLLTIAATLIAYAPVTWSAAQPLAVIDDQVQRSNGFVQNLQKLHRQQLDGKTIKKTEEVGGYRDFPNFYREVSYYDAATGRMLSRIQWERDNPERIHSIEVFVYDAQGRVVRDYSAWFLPGFRNAPRETNINFYGYANGVRAWRQFDVFGNHVYEKCNAGEQVLFEHWDDDIFEAQRDPNGVMQTDDYRRCFATLVTSPGKYVVPH